MAVENDLLITIYNERDETLLLLLLRNVTGTQNVIKSSTDNRYSE